MNNRMSALKVRESSRSGCTNPNLEKVLEEYEHLPPGEEPTGG